MKKVVVLSVLLLTVFFSFTIIAQELGAIKKSLSTSFLEKVQTPLGPPLAAGTYTVGNGGNFPTIDSTFKKLSIDGIAGAVDLILIDTLYQAQNGQLFKLGPITGAGPNSRITIRPKVGTKVTLRGDSTAVLTFIGTKYLTLDGNSNPSSSSAEIMIHALYNTESDWNDCIDVWGDADYNQFLNLTFKTEDYRPLGTCLAMIHDGTNRPDSNLVEGNLVSGMIGVGVWGGALSNSWPRGNIIRGNTIGSVSDTLAAWGISSEYTMGTVIESNIVQFLRKAMYPDYTFGIEAYVNTNTIIRNNVIHSLFGSSGSRVIGIAGAGNASAIGQGIKIYNNIIYDLNNSSTTGNGYIGGILTWYNNNILVAYNSVQISGTGVNPVGTDALGLDVGSTSVTIRNNILVNTYQQTTGGPSSALWLSADATFTSDYNDLYVNSTLPNNYTAYLNTSYLSLSAWKKTGKDFHSISEMPNFISEDLHINQFIPTYLESAGTSVSGINLDFDGDLRNASTPDIGADEFNGIIKPPPALVSIPEAIDFGNVSIGKFSDTISVTVKNQNAQSVTINSITTSQPAFHFLNLPNLPSSLAAYDSIVFKVFFNPLTYGAFDDNITISNSDTISPNAEISLKGNVLLLGPQFQMFYDKVNSASYPQKSAIVDSFLTAHPVLPFIEDTIAHFIFNGSANSINIPSDANGWTTFLWPMYKLAGTNLWFRTETFERDARIEYKFFLNGSNWIADPKNPKIFGYYSNSVLAMPDYVFPSEVNYYAGIPHGTKFDTTLYSSQLLYNKFIRIYLPPGYNPASLDTYPVIVFHDGDGWWNDGKANNILDYLIDKKLIKPLIGVFVTPTDRNNEYAFNKTSEYESFIVNELMPYIDSRFRTKTNPSQRAMTGYSYGGLITTQICYNHPEIFGLAAPFSPAYEPKSMEVLNTVVNGPKKDIRWYLEWGTYEIDVYQRVIMKDALIINGYDVMWREWHEGHTLGSWMAHLDIALEYFFPGDSAAVDVEDEFELPTSYSLRQNFPNPFNPNTTIGYQLPRYSMVTIKLYDILGREVETLFNEEKEAGSYEVEFKAEKLSSGVYFYQLKAGEFSSTKKMILLR